MIFKYAQQYCFNIFLSQPGEKGDSQVLEKVSLQVTRSLHGFLLVLLRDPVIFVILLSPVTSLAMSKWFGLR